MNSKNTKFISIIAHDLRSPFSSIIGALELLKLKLDHYHLNEVEQYVDIAFDSSVKTLTLLDNLLAWTISQNVEKSFNPVKINVYELVMDEIESINTAAFLKQITLKHTIPGNLKVLLLPHAPFDRQPNG